MMIKGAGIIHPTLDPPKSTDFLDLQKLLPGGRKGPASLGPTSRGRGFLLLLFFMFPGHLQTRADIPSDLQGTGLRWQRGVLVLTSHQLERLVAGGGLFLCSRDVPWGESLTWNRRSPVGDSGFRKVTQPL